MCAEGQRVSVGFLLLHHRKQATMAPGLEHTAEGGSERNEKVMERSDRFHFSLSHGHSNILQQAACCATCALMHTQKRKRM